MDRVVPSTQKNLEGLDSVSTWKRDYGLRPRCIPQSVVRSTAVISSYWHDWVLVSNKMAPVHLLFRLSRWLHLSPLRIIFWTMKLLAGQKWNQQLGGSSFFPISLSVTVSLQLVDEVCAWRLQCGLFICLPRRLKAVIANPLYNKITD